MRGEHLPDTIDRVRHPGIIPAYAGSTTRRYLHLRRGPDHPRIRGEHPDPSVFWTFSRGSSPHTRGAPQSQRHLRRADRIIPAYAGSTTIATSIRSTGWDHPRIRGEHEVQLAGEDQPEGSSPHTRGARRRGAARHARRRIIPAYAGSTTRRYQPLQRGPDHPRIRGEHRQEGRTSGLVWWIIPAYAGSTPLSLSLARGARIIPAYAGSTAAPPRRRAMKPDHPRIRGEHREGSNGYILYGGSSPHTRGARCVPRQG